MPPLQIQEERPQWVEIMQYLHKHGAHLGPGYRIDQKLFAKTIGVNPTTLGKYLQLMEQYGVIRVDRTTTDGAFGSPRAHNRYHLLCTVQRWTEQLGPAIIAEKRERIRAQRAAINRNTLREYRRQKKIDRLAVEAAKLGVPLGRPKKEQPVERPEPAEKVEPNVLTPDELEDLAAFYDDADDAELVGW